MTANSKRKISINRLIRFFKSFKTNPAQNAKPDYSAWDQTEAEYQRQQAEWLKRVREKKTGTDTDSRG
ncbi:MAG: hypothetical protein ACQERN_03590 [Thermodesulfobacteriota bacterium]